jgi:hypothetical protein
MAPRGLVPELGADWKIVGSVSGRIILGQFPRASTAISASRLNPSNRSPLPPDQMAVKWLSIRRLRAVRASQVPSNRIQKGGGPEGVWFQ